MAKSGGRDKRRKKQRRRPPGTRPGQRSPGDDAPEQGFQDEPNASVGRDETRELAATTNDKAAGETMLASKPGAVVSVAAGGGLAIYKPGQGYYTRMGTVVGFGVLSLAGLAWLHGKLELVAGGAGGIYIQNGVVFGLFVAFAAAFYWVAGRYRRTCDFMIATEGEMKKVSWPSKKEIIGSTKVVLGGLVIMALLLFLVDVGFRRLFEAVNVLRIGEAPK